MRTRRAGRQRKGRRDFLRRLGASVAASVGAPAIAAAVPPKSRPERSSPARPPTETAVPRSAGAGPPPLAVGRGDWPRPDPGARVDFAPARWIWLPSQRTLANTFVLFRREIDLEAEPVSARGWISADSRYRLWVNGRRVQWGPAPCDPRSYDVDPLDLTEHLRPGPNVIGAEVLFYGHGEGTWPGGKPGFLFALRVDEEGGRVQEVYSDGSWLARLDRAHRPGQAKRAYLRALQEEFDARLHPEGWSEPGLRLDEAWVTPLALEVAADRPAAASSYYDYLTDSRLDPEGAELRARDVPLVRETEGRALRLVRSGRVRWRRDPRDWFEFRLPGAFELVDETAAFPSGEGAWMLSPAEGEGVGAIFELAEQVVGFPFFTVEAPAGTVVELMTQEAHDPSAAAWLDTHHFSWSRFVCREGANRFEAFDYESLRFLQVHVREAAGPVLLRDVGVRRRSFDWPRPPHFRCAEGGLQRLLDASFNTLVNAAAESTVTSYLPHATRLVCGDTSLCRRFLRTFALGQALEGYFLDGWPGWDRLNRIAQRQLGATPWGPRLDQGVGFIDDVWHHYLVTGEADLVRELYPRLLRFARFLLERRDANGLLPVEGWGVPTVWMDNAPCFPRQRHKQCAFNLFTAAVLRDGLAALARLAGDAGEARRLDGAAGQLVAAVVARFWSPERALFVSNLPWQGEEGGERLDDRSLANALLFDQCPGGQTTRALEVLAEPPAGLGLSNPANAHWRLQALARHGRIDVVLRELRHRWAALPSVLLNNTIAESWEVRPDSTDRWSHCAVSPLVILFMDVAGIRPAAPGFGTVSVRPQLGDLRGLELTAHTVRGPIGFRADSTAEGHHVWVTLPAGCTGELLLPEAVPCELPPLVPDRTLGLARYRLAAGETTLIDLPRQGA